MLPYHCQSFRLGQTLVEFEGLFRIRSRQIQDLAGAVSRRRENDFGN